MSVKVAVRVRPFNQREKDLKSELIVDMEDPLTMLKPFKGQAQRKFTFDFSFWSFDGFIPDEKGYLKPNSGSKYSDQKTVQEKIGKSILDNAWQGYHCCLFAYGQTGSGKSYSMIGYGENKGIIPITCAQIFQRMQKKKEGQEYEVYASMLEIYNEQIHDLTIAIGTRQKGGLKVRQNKLLGVYVDGLSKHFVNSYKEIENVMDQGTKNRTIASTQMNATSSRAHTIITIEFHQITKSSVGKSQKISVINLIDLAGSERQSKTGASGDRLKQGAGINLSLTTLGQVISVLAENSEGANKFVPYRNSSLTRILSNALGGNSQTIMICALSPASDNYQQNLSTLRYADSAKKIKNKPVINQTAQDKLIRQLRQQNARLKELLAKRQKESVPQNITPNPNNKPQQSKGSQKKEPQQPKESQNKIKNEQIKPGQNKVTEDNDKQKSNNQLQSQMNALQQKLKQMEMSMQQKIEQAKTDQKKLHETTGNLLMKGDLLQMQAKGQKLPPYFENISKDIAIHRKLKIIINKEIMRIGKINADPPNDIIFGGRDVFVNHATLRKTQDGKVYLRPLGKGAHLYVNGLAVENEVELQHLSRVIFGWNSAYLFKNKYDNRIDEKVGNSRIDWQFCKLQVQALVDIDQSDDEDQGGCCQIY